jgi:hypothetical protein
MLSDDKAPVQDGFVLAGKPGIAPVSEVIQFIRDNQFYRLS